MHKLHGVLLGVSVLPALLIMPVMAAAPDTENTVFVFGDVTFDNQHVANGEAAFGGRRMDNWSGGKYQNDFPRYKMLGRSMAMSNSDAYIGPVELTMGDLGDAAFAFNYQINEVDVNLAEMAGVTWNQDYDTVFDNVADIIGEGNAGYTAGPVYAMAIRDDSKEAGSLSFSNSTVMVDGSTIDANTISITNGSALTFVKQDHSKLGAFLEGVIDSDGNTTLTADTITVNASQFNVNSGATLNITTTDTETGTTFSNLSTDKGALSVIDGSAHIGGDTLVFNNNTSSSHGAGLYYKETTTGLDSSVVLDAENITFSNNTSNCSASSGGAVFNSGGDVSILGDTNTFTGNQILGTDVDEKLFKRGGGAIANQSYETEAPSDKQPLDATMVIGTANSVNTFSNNTSSMNGGAIMNRAVDTDGNATLTINGTTTFSGNTATLNGGAIYNVQRDGKTATVNLNNGTYTFTQNTADGKGGAIYNEGELTLTNTSLAGNTATERGGAVFNYGELTIDGGVFASNSTTSESYPSQGGAIYNAGDVDYLDKYGILTVSNTTFGDANDITKGNIAMQGGAISNDSGNGYNAELTLNNTNFYYNKAQSAADGGYSALGGAIHNLSNADVIVNGDTIFKGNSAVGYSAEGGAIYNSSWETFTFNDAVTFDSNIVEDTNGANGGLGGAISNADGTMVFKDVATFTNNKAIGDGQTSGGAVHNAGTLTFEKGGLFEGNEAMYGGALFNNSGSLTITDASFANNEAGDEGGAIFNLFGTTNINAVTENVIFSGNIADDEVNDITNYYGTLNLNAANGKSISLQGISGPSGTLNINSVVGNTGTVEVSEYLANHTVNVDAGELHLTTGEANLYNSNVFVADGATINTIDDEINDYMTGEDNNGTITLSDGALVAGDIDYVNGLADTYSADDGATITYTLANALNLTGIQYGVAKEIRVTNTGATVNKGAGFAWLDSDHGLTLESGGVGTGTILLAGASGGINAAVDATDETVQEIVYTLTAANETFNGADNVIQNANMTVSGNGNETTSNTIVFENDMIVDGTSTLVLNDINLTKTGDETIINQAGGNLSITDARVGVNITNYGTLVSDPTYYDAQVVNSGTASFNGDIFESTSSLINNGGEVSLTDVEFVQGSTVSGDGNGHLNIQNGQTIFDTVVQNNTLTMTNGANVVVGQHGSLDGVGITAAGGTINLNNSHIDELGDLVANGNVGMSLDANFNSGEADTVSHVTGSGKLLINNINLLSSSYSDTEGAFSWTVAENDTNSVELANGFTVTGGTNYFTSVTTDGQNIIFSDKLMNSSGVYAQLGSWNGTIIGTSTEYDSETNSYSSTAGTTVGAALTALENAVNGKQNTITNTATIAADGTGFSVVAGSIGATQLAANSVASTNIIDGTIVNADIATGTITTDRLANQNVSQFINNAGYQNATQVSDAITTALANGTDAYQTASQVNTTVGGAITNALGDGGAVANAIAAATTMTDDGNPGTSLYNNFAEGVSVTNAIASIDAAVGTTANGAHVSATNSVGQNLNALDNAIGSTTAGTYVSDTNSVGQNINALDTALATVNGNISAATTAIGSTTDGTHVFAANSVGTNINALDTALVAVEGTVNTHTAAIGTTTTGAHVLATNSVGQNINALDTALSTAEANIDANTAAIATLNAGEDVAGSVRNIIKSYAFAGAEGAYEYAEKLVDTLDENLSAGIASAVALSSVAVSDVRRGEMSVGAGYGYFNGQSAAAFGAAMGISNRWSVNAGAGVSGYDVSFRAGTNYKFKLF